MSFKKKQRKVILLNKIKNKIKTNYEKSYKIKHKQNKRNKE